MHSQPYSRPLQIALPSIIALLLILLGMALTPAPLRLVEPPLLLPLLYFWAVLYPRGLSLLSVFILGLISDILMGIPLGTLPLISLLLHWLGHRDEYLPRRGFKAIWLRFCLHGALAMLAYYILLSMYQWRWMAWPPVAIQSLLMMACYPALHWLQMHLLRVMKVELNG